MRSESMKIIDAQACVCIFLFSNGAALEQGDVVRVSKEDASSQRNSSEGNGAG